MRARALLPILIIGIATLVNAQGGPRLVTEKEARAVAAAAFAAAKNDPDEFSKLFVRQIAELAPGYTGRPLVVYFSDELSIYVMGRVELFQFTAKEAVRKMESVPSEPLDAGPSVAVGPRQIGSPDIIKIVVTRGDAPVTPLTNELKPEEMSTRMGAKRTIHSGRVVYPPETFLPGAPVTVTAVPESGRNIIKTFTDNELRQLQ